MDEAGLAWRGHKARKVLMGICRSTGKEKGCKLHLQPAQEEGCKLHLLFCLLKPISVPIFCDLFQWKFCVEIGNRNNEKGKSDSVELVGKYYCSCSSWSFKSQSLKEREGPLIAPGLPHGSECLSALS